MLGTVLLILLIFAFAAAFHFSAGPRISGGIGVLLVVVLILAVLRKI
ncbi:DUF3309 domain-containing protein [Rhizobium sp. J15]|nr:DUF3309 domain-containing protein [Rhizobium sp. J15]PDT15891.1 DUF3309 domain-containing protein [Rhizobium sp. J15]